ncbi:TPA: hypothetical protein ACYSGT_003667 [Pseudomonas aeruginosa]
MSEVTNKGGALRKVGRATAWVGKKWVWTVTGDWREARQNAKRIYNLLKSLTGRTYREESFSEAVSRLSLSEKDLDARCRYLHALSVLFGLMAIVAGVFLALVPWSPSPINHGLMSFGVLALSITRFLVTRFRVAQIRERRLFSFKSWLLRQEERS